MIYSVTLDGHTFEIDLGGVRPRIDGVEVDADLSMVPGTTLYHLRLDGEAHRIGASPIDRRGEWKVDVRGRTMVADVLDERARAIRAMNSTHQGTVERTLVAPMPGLVIRVDVQPGDQVRAGQGVVIVEAMKMENELKAPGDGTVVRVNAVAGQTVDRGAILLVLE